MKKVLTFLVTFVLLSMAAFASAAKGKVLGIVMPNATHGFLGESIKHARAAAVEYSKANGFEYKFLTSAEASEQNNQLDTLINEKVDCIVLWPHNGNELRSGAMKVMEAKIPLIIYDRLIDGFTPTVEVMGDNFTIGEETGKYLNKYFAEDLKKGKVNILEFKGDNSTVPQQRSDGFKKTADPNINIIQQFSTDWQRAKAQEQMETLLNSLKKEEIESIKAVFTHDDEVVLGVLDAIMSYNGDAKLDIKLVTGVGGRKENIETFDPMKKDLKIDQVTYLFSPTMVREAVKMGADILDGKTYSGLQLIPTEVIDNNNYNDYMKSSHWKIRYESGI
ncbi:substrate-binding domain-containing protein [Fusobacterium sp. PH5-44]|uniref:substrate-binding domain-containing protein n=1 Tax=unclassified Fusobacterium TaxID=2648384 RepID=UPI003D1DA252